MIRLAEFDGYDAAVRGFRWSRPAHYNIFDACCGSWAKTSPDRTALVFAGADGRPLTVSYGRLEELSARCANAFMALGVTRGDRVAIHLGQTLETVVAHLAAYRLGAIALPLAAVFGPDAILYRLETAAARLLLTTRDAAERLPPTETTVVTADGGTRAAQRADLASLMAQAATSAPVAATGPDDPALMVFTSGTTGQPKGALHGHRVLLGHLPGVQMHHDLMPHDGDRLWTPADWAWAGGLLNVLLPGLAMGVPVVAQRSPRFDPEDALAWAAEMGVRNAFIPPTALRLMQECRPSLDLRSVGSGGEQLGAATFEWGREHLGVTINEFYGQTECNLVLSSCAAWGVAEPGVIARAVPGHEVAIIDGAGQPVSRGTQGTIAIRRPDPVMFLGYWNSPEATAEKFIGDYMTTGDQGIEDDRGVRFVGRDDDVITSAGYRIGPGEIESCLAAHPQVALAAVVGKPDAVRTEIVTAFVKLLPGAVPSETLKGEIQAHVRDRLSAHEYPREVTFVEDIPLTTTGKVIRRAFRS